MKFLPSTSRSSAKLYADGDECKAIAKVFPWDFPGLKYSVDFLTLPAEPRLYEIIKGKTKIVGDKGVLGWYNAERKIEQDKVAMLNVEDTQLQHQKSCLLYPYQRVGAKFIAQTGNCILADEPGLGKTAQTIIGIEEASMCCVTVLVLCPNTVKLHWEAEIHKWSQDDPTYHDVTVVTTKNRRKLNVCAGWYIINYELFRITPWFQAQQWDWVVVDEAQSTKNRGTKLYKAIKSLTTAHHVLLSGTPFGNNPSELWTLLNIIDPKHYPSFWRFYEMYVNYTYGYIGQRIVEGVKNTFLLRRDLASRMVQRKKVDVYKQLPDKIIRRLPIEPSPLQKKVYIKAAQEWLVVNEGKPVTEIRNALSAMLRLRQILSTPMCISGEYGYDMPDDSSKLDAAMELIQKTTESVLVMSLFRGTVKAMQQRLIKANIRHNIIMGGMGDQHAAEVQRQLNAGEIRVVVCTMQSGGVGLNLIGANIVIVVDKHYNPEKQTQAYDRVHRIGQEKTVYINELVCPDTVDILVEKILDRKIAMTNAVLAESLLTELKTYIGDNK